MTVRIRASREEDAAQLVHVHERCWTISYAGLANPSWILDRPLAERIAEWRGYATGRGVPMWVAVDGDDVIGFVAAGASRDEDAPPRTGEVVALYVDPSRQGAGVGRKLLRRATGQLRKEGFRRATLWTLTGSEQSRGFYERNGWRLEGARKTDRWPHLRYERRL